MNRFLLVMALGAVAGSAFGTPADLSQRMVKPDSIGFKHMTYKVATGERIPGDMGSIERIGSIIWQSQQMTGYFFGAGSCSHTPPQNNEIILDWGDIQAGSYVNGIGIAYSTNAPTDPNAVTLRLVFLNNSNGFDENQGPMAAGFTIQSGGLPPGWPYQFIGWFITLDLEGTGLEFALGDQDLDGDGLADFAYYYQVLDATGATATGPLISEPNDPLSGPGAEDAFDLYIQDPNNPCVDPNAPFVFDATYWFGGVIFAQFHLVLYGGEPSDCPACATLTLTADDSCYTGPGSSVTVTIEATDLTTSIVGGQFFLAYDNTVLDFVSAAPGDPLFSQLFSFVDEDLGTIDYVVNAPSGHPGTAEDVTMVELTFTALTNVCNAAELVTFRPNVPPTRLSSFGGESVVLELHDLGPISIGVAPPVIICPPDIVVNADAGFCSAQLDPGVAMAAGGCISGTTLFVIDGSEVRAYDASSPGQALWSADAGAMLAGVALIPDGSQAVVAVVRDDFAWTYAFDGDTGAPLWEMSGSIRGTPRDVQKQLYTDALTYPFGPPRLNNSAPHVLVVSGTTSPFTTALVNSRTGAVYWTHTGSLFGHAFLPVSGELRYDILARSHSDGDIARIDGLDGKTVLWSTTVSSFSSPIPIPDMTGDGQYDIVTRANWNPSIYWLDGDNGSLVRSMNYSSFDVLGVAITSGTGGSSSDAIFAAQGGSMGRYRNSDGSLVWSQGTFFDTTMLGILNRADGAAVLAGLRHQFRAGIAHADDGQVLVDDIPCDDADSGAWGATDLTGDGYHDIFSVSGGILRLYEGATGAVVGSFPGIPAVSGATWSRIGGSGSGVDVTFTRSDGALSLTDPYHAAESPISITWTATDVCGNTSMCVQTVTVNPVNEVVVQLSLQPTVDSPLTRCITFEVWECGSGVPLTVEREVTFVNGSASAVFEAPCGEIECLTVRDRLHTLRRTLTAPDITVVGSQYVADLDVLNKHLIGGDLNDDGFVDILDFGVFTSQFGVNFGTGDTSCATPAPHSDISGDGLVTTGDFTFFQINFLASDEPNCCGAQRQGAGPTTRISVAELRARGLGALAVADLNGDGWLDELDMIAFMHGARPAGRPTTTLETGPVVDPEPAERRP